MTATFVRLPDAVASLAPFADAGVLAASDVHVAAWVARASGVSSPEVVYAVAMAAWAARNGHSCADLDELVAVVERHLRARSSDERSAELPSLPWPSADAVLAALATEPSVARVVHEFDVQPSLDRCPVVVHGRRVYLQRHWVDECVVAAALRRSATGGAVASLAPTAATLLDALLPAQLDGEPNLQRHAADVALAQRLAVVVGGPGTGKTYTVARLLAVLVEQARSEGRHLQIGLAAPTGKAAQRLRESILAAVADDAGGSGGASLPPEVRQVLEGLAPRTIHRLLGRRQGRNERFFHDAENPLPYDVVVVDETSMVSAPLFARLLDAVGPDTRLVLLGDPDQLESVDRGAVLSDVVAAAHRQGSPLHGHTVRLRRGHRFGAESQIARFADAVRDGEPDAAVRLLRDAPPLDAEGRGVRFVATANPVDTAGTAAVAAVLQPVLREVRTAAERGDAATALARMASVRVLCAHREGSFGVSVWNRLGERWMCGASGAGTAWYAGRPLLVTQNDARLGLANGDAGVVVRHDDRLVVAFPGHDTLFDPVQLEHVQTAFAITVHKSQGSEYPTVVMVLPPPTSPLVGRELVYTGVTRAKRALHVVGSEPAVRACVAGSTVRMTGLADALRG